MTDSPHRADSPRSDPRLAPIERFIREVLPAIPGGRHTSTDTRGHHGLIQRAARQRGLTVTEVDGSTQFHDGRRLIGGMTGWVPTLVSAEALDICRSKHRTKEALVAAGVPTPAGIDLNHDQLDQALAYVAGARGPLVLKPSKGGKGVGITTGITTADDLRAAWTTATQASAEPKPVFVLEEQVDGVDVRAFVIGRRVAAAATRVNAHVVGDGRRTISELIAEKQRWRDEHVILRKRPFTVEPALMARLGRTVDDVPAHGEVVVVNSLANVHLGGENADVTELVHPDLMTMAVDAVRAIPGLGLAGVDIQTPNIRSADGAVVLEANVGANIRVHNCPAHGRPRDLGGAILDEMIAKAETGAR